MKSPDNSKKNYNSGALSTFYSPKNLKHIKYVENPKN